MTHIEPQRPDRIPPPYLKGKDIKTQGDCLVYCFLKKYVGFMVGTQGYPQNKTNEPPEDFIKW